MISPIATKGITELATAPTAPPNANKIETTAISQNSFPSVLVTARRIPPLIAPDRSTTSKAPPANRTKKSSRQTGPSPPEVRGIYP